MLIGMDARIVALEQSVAAGNSTMDQLGTNINGMLSHLAAIEGMFKVVDDLKQNLRDLTKKILRHIFGQVLEEDLEKQGQ